MGTPELRIVSLLPAATEIVCALDLEHALVGRSHECDFPASVATRPALTEPRLDAARPSAAIHADVEALLGDALGIYALDAARLAELRPSHVLTQVQCSVCAVSEAEVERALCSWTGGEARVVSLAASTLDEVFADMLRVADALRARDAGAVLVSALARRMAEIAGALAAAPARSRIAVLEWSDPLIGAGHWLPELVDMAGGTLLFGERGGRSPRLTLEALAAADPDVVLVTPCGFSLARARAEAEALCRRPAFAALRAVREGRLFAGDGNQFFNRPGPRLVETLEILAEVLHGPAVYCGHEGTGWERLVGVGGPA